MTLPIAMDVLRGYLGSGNLALVMAAMSMSVLPVILLFLLAQKMVIEGVAHERNQELRGPMDAIAPNRSRRQDRSAFRLSAASAANMSPFRSAASARAAFR